MRKIRTGDEVMVMVGKSKGRRGKVSQVITKVNKYNRKTRLMVIVEGLNLVKKCVKANPQEGVQGGIVTKEATLDISNVALWNKVTQKPDKVKFKVIDGKKARFFKSDDQLIDTEQAD